MARKNVLADGFMVDLYISKMWKKAKEICIH